MFGKFGRSRHQEPTQGSQADDPKTAQQDSPLLYDFPAAGLQAPRPQPERPQPVKSVVMGASVGRMVTDVDDSPHLAEAKRLFGAARQGLASKGNQLPKVDPPAKYETFARFLPEALADQEQVSADQMPKAYTPYEAVPPTSTAPSQSPVSPQEQQGGSEWDFTARD